MPSLHDEYKWVYNQLVAAFGEKRVRIDLWNDGKNLAYMVWKRDVEAPDNPYCWLMQMEPEKAEVEMEHKGYLVKGSRSLSALASLTGIEQYARQALPYFVEYHFNDQPDRVKEAADEVEKIKKWFEQ